MAWYWPASSSSSALLACSSFSVGAGSTVAAAASLPTECPGSTASTTGRHRAWRTRRGAVPSGRPRRSPTRTSTWRIRRLATNRLATSHEPLSTSACRTWPPGDGQQTRRKKAVRTQLVGVRYLGSLHKWDLLSWRYHGLRERASKCFVVYFDPYIYHLHASGAYGHWCTISRAVSSNTCLSNGMHVGHEQYIYLSSGVCCVIIFIAF
jgi:hypothetical protein